ncbi:MAG: toxin [Sulfurovum sp.]|nr:toxin [Sulfurovum sp.]
MNFKWNIEKNKLLKKERDVCFEDVVTQIYEDKVLDIIKHPNAEKYPHQKIYIVILNNYVHIVPFVKENGEIFLKTIVPSRKMHKAYKGGQNENGSI